VAADEQILQDLVAIVVQVSGWDACLDDGI
jgi:hypothetical protein